MKKIMLIAVLVLIAIGIGRNMHTTATNPQPEQATGCTVSNIALDKLKAQDIGHGYQRITGRLTNNCDQPTGVQVKITSYDKNGNILASDDIWPASVSNIPAHSTFPFEWQTENPTMQKFDAGVTEVMTWPKGL